METSYEYLTTPWMIRTRRIVSEEIEHIDEEMEVIEKAFCFSIEDEDTVRFTSNLMWDKYKSLEELRRELSKAMDSLNFKLSVLN